MSNKNDDFDFDDFLMFETMKGGGGCLVSALSIIGTIGVIVALFIQAKDLKALFRKSPQKRINFHADIEEKR